ncbi:DUF4097 family beta strand repeat-containing protein [Streptomyces sp. SBT349]|uniref:DUF4097 family beta strand repeat-containing protein n=1 Tax=Streptomyces sp. SBT349 TaxID=1580539 RepID=UPI00066A4984|nr:DUF4097 family beta strand repeat-containing protein [Streptomyces sp. SBT349]
MPGKSESEWSVDREQKLTFDDERIDELEVRLVNGAVNVVGTGDAAVRAEIGEVEGPPLVVRRSGHTLTIAYDDVPWKGWLRWLDRKGWRRSAVVSVSVPAGTRVSVGVVGASAVISGITGQVDVRGINGPATLVGLGGLVRADTVSGDIEAQGLSGELRFNSVSGQLTVIDSRSPAVRADSVSGDMVLDLAPGELPTDIKLNTVSGAVALRLADPLSATIEASTASGPVSSSFTELGVSGAWGAKHLAGTIGSGTGSVVCHTVSGAIAVLRRPPDRYDSPVGSSARKDF